MKRLEITNKEEGKRLDIYLKEHIKNLSRTKIKQMILEGSIKVNDCLTKPSYILKKNDDIIVELKEEEELTYIKPYPFFIEIIYEDEDIIVINKPSGLVVHPPNPNRCQSVVNALIYMGKNLSSISPLRRGVVHRLDKETSGVMVMAKNNYAHYNLIQQFKERIVSKEYHAIVWGNIREDRLRIELPIRRDKLNRLKMKVSFLKAKFALTHLEVINRFRDSTYIKLKPVTGRMHQIRVHLNFLGFPIIGDKRYGIKDNHKYLFLHAYCLRFKHPQKGEFMEFKVELPDWFKNYIDNKLCTK